METTAWVKRASKSMKTDLTLISTQSDRLLYTLIRPHTLSSALMHPHQLQCTLIGFLCTLDGYQVFSSVSIHPHSPHPPNQSYCTFIGFQHSHQLSYTLNRPYALSSALMHYHRLSPPFLTFICTLSTDPLHPNPPSSTLIGSHAL